MLALSRCKSIAPNCYWQLLALSGVGVGGVGVGGVLAAGVNGAETDGIQRGWIDCVKLGEGATGGRQKVVESSTQVFIAKVS
jgi:hypothetical protein